MIHTHFKLDLECGQGHKCLHIMLLRKWGHIPFYSECNSSVFGWVHTCIYVQLVIRLLKKRFQAKCKLCPINDVILLISLYKVSVCDPIQLSLTWDGPAWGERRIRQDWPLGER